MSLIHPLGRGYSCIVVMLTALLMLSFMKFAQAQEKPKPLCYLNSDNNPEIDFDVSNWVSRGACIRSQHKDQTCKAILSNLLQNLDQLRDAEYGGAASVLSLLPTIGALFGTPTSEIWRLKSIVPFGGILAMAVSFGGALMPVRVENYENTVSQRNTAIGSIISLRSHLPGSPKDEQTVEEKLETLGVKIRERIDRRESVRLPKASLIIGLFGMVMLFAMAQGAMGVIEQGGVVNWWCSGRWWMHLWYIAVTFTAFTEDRVQSPFVKTYKLYVSSLPYDAKTSGGQSITECFSDSTASENVGLALRQLKTLRPASLNVYGSTLRTRSRNSVMVMVSVVGGNTGDSIWRLLSKTLNVAVFVLGTAIFASATLLSLVMAIVVLTLTLSAGVFGRAIAGWIVGQVSGTEPMIHVISGTEPEAYQAITKILCLGSKDRTPYQVEINGHIFINKRRVASRSKLKVAILGVLAEPYDVTKAYQGTTISPVGTMSLNALSPQPTNISMSGVLSPFTSGAADPLLPTNSMNHGGASSWSQQNFQNSSADSTTNFNNQISRKPVPSTNYTQ